MKAYGTVALVLSALVSSSSAHYIFQQLSYAGTTYPIYQYIRQNTNYNSPVIDLASNDLRCNVGGVTAGSTTTITMKAGDAFTFTTDVAVYHQGPLSIYMAKAPTTAAAFDGSGQVWFKILDIGPDFSTGQAVWNLAQSYSYRIPTALPSGDYLLRIQQLAIHNPYPAGIPQFYISCAQVTVTNGGAGTPGPLVKIPGFITGTEPGYVVNIYSSFTNYTTPGPPVWGGQNAPGGSGGGGNAGTTTGAPAPTPTTSKISATTLTTSKISTPSGTIIEKYGQCGGQGWTGGTVCAAGSTCKVASMFYSQCL